MNEVETVKTPIPVPTPEALASEVTPVPVKYRGVYQQKGSNKFYAVVLLNKDEEGKRKQKYVGSYATQEEAAVARNAYIDEHNLTCRKTKV